MNTADGNKPEPRRAALGLGMKRVLVVGGSGFVGSHVVRTALSHGGLRVASVSRTGQPTTAAPDLEGAEWLQGDVSKPDDLRRVLAEVDGVVSCLGGFGTNDAMRALNGEANAALAQAAAASGVKRFAYVSAAPSRLFESFGPIGQGGPLPVWWPFGPGYFEGKRIAEAAVGAHFGASGLALRPGFVYGSMEEAGRLWKAPALVGAPLEAVFSAGMVRGLARTLGPLGDLLAPPASVADVASAAVAHLVTAGGGDSGEGSDPAGLCVVEGPGLVALARKLGRE